MALYGFDFYSGARYGAPVVLEFAAENFTAESREYGEVFLSWNNPTGAWSQFRLVRNAYGVPVDQDDGFVLIDTTNPSTTYTDRDLPEGRFQYYAIFVLADEDGLWHLAAETLVLVLKDYGTNDQLYDLMPEWYRQNDQRIRASDEHPLLYNFLGVFGRGIDSLRVEYESLTWVYDPDRVSGGLLPVFAQQFGVEWEPELGMRQMRRYLRNVIHLYKLKGTRLGIEGAASALTGWGADAWWDATPQEVAIELSADRINFVTNPSFENNLTGWTNVANAHLTQSAVQTFSGSNSMAASATNPGDMTIAHTDLTELTPGETYTFSIYARSGADLRQVQVSIDWQDAAGASLGTTAWNGLSEVAGEWVRPSITATAPVGAVQADARVQVLGAGAETHYFDAALFEANLAVLTYFDGAQDPLGDHLWEGTAHNSRTHYYRHRPLKNQRLNQLISKFTPIGVAHRLVYALTP